MVFRGLCSILFCLLFAGLTAQEKVSMYTNLLQGIPAGRSLTFEVQVAKGNITGFSRLQLDVPEGITIAQVDSRDGEFSFSENKAKIIWVVTPADSVLSVRMKLMPVQQTQNADFFFQYHYMEDDVKREFEAVPFIVHIKDTVLPVFLSAPMVELRSRNAPPLPLPAKDTVLAKKDKWEIEQQVKQLKKDSRDAQAVGEYEKEKALRRLDSLDALVKAAESISDSTQRQQRMDDLSLQKNKVNEDLIVANRVLVLAKTLDGQADHIAKLNEEQMVQVSKPTGTLTTAAFVSRPAATKVPEPPKAEKKEDAVSPKTAGIIYRVQLGSFIQKPALQDFAAYGKVSVVIENNLYKVLHGSFQTREEAVRRKEEILKTLPGCFIATYQDGVRIH